jgi:uncharacterized protein (DUF2141 family)
MSQTIPLINAVGSVKPPFCWRTPVLILWLLACCGISHAADLTVNFGPPRSATGVVIVAVFNSALTFPKPGQYFKFERVRAEATGGAVTFHDLPAGQYAVSAIHDENENGKLDTNIVGIPTESFGFSKDAIAFGGPPTFEKAAIDVVADSMISIQLR